MIYIPNIAMWMPGLMELVVILIIALLLFGKRIPEIGRSLGGFLGEFKKGVDEVDKIKKDIKKEITKVKDDITK